MVGLQKSMFSTGHRRMVCSTVGLQKSLPGFIRTCKLCTVLGIPLHLVLSWRFRVSLTTCFRISTGRFTASNKCWITICKFQSTAKVVLWVVLLFPGIPHDLQGPRHARWTCSRLWPPRCARTNLEATWWKTQQTWWFQQQKFGFCRICWEISPTTKIQPEFGF